jgi:hypothetical protein
LSTHRAHRTHYSDHPMFSPITQYKFALLAERTLNQSAELQTLLASSTYHQLDKLNTKAQVSTMPTQQYFDPAGETEPENTLYTLTVRCPPRPPPKWLPSFMTRQPVTLPPPGHSSTIKPDNTNPDFDCFEQKHLDEMPTKTVKIKRASFPVEMRCEHLRHETTCEKGCYVLEKGGSIWRTKCKRNDCEGHVYCGRVKEDEEGKSCFGKKGERMVCVES